MRRGSWQGPTIAEIAAEAGVSTATVDRVVNGRGGVAAEKAQAVLAALERRQGPAVPAAAPTIRLGFACDSGRTFTATLVASAGAVASSTGTVLAQFGIDNKDGALQPGSYAEVRFPLPAGAKGIRVPATALLFRNEGMQVATVDANNRVRLKTIHILRDTGAAMDVGGGVSDGDRIIDNPSDALTEGDEVRVAGK